MIHQPHLTAELRELPPEDGWACHEATGRACAVCPCGLNTGFIDKGEAARTYAEHPDSQLGSNREAWLLGQRG